MDKFWDEVPYFYKPKNIVIYNKAIKLIVDKLI